MTKSKQALGLAAWLVITFIAAAIAATASVNAGAFYEQLVLPGWSPPAWLFGPVWTVLYTLMGISAWLVWRTNGFTDASRALLLYGSQLALNALWSWLFFGWKLGGLAFLDILLLILFITATLAAFWRIQKLAGALLIPYLLWVCFASLLNYMVWQLNPLYLS